jgi:outer membrane protein OmpA-like peptidoglycan-associated protein
VPAPPVPVSPGEQAAVGERLAGTPENAAAAASAGVSAPSPEALAGLELPGAPPPAPDVPDLVIPQAPAGPAVPPANTHPPAPPPVRPPSAPVALAFPPGSAVLDSDAAVALSGVAAAVGNGQVLVAGFGEAAAATNAGGDAAAMTLALARARRLADALTADGIRPSAINLLAAAGGSGGFVQLFY